MLRDYLMGWLITYHPGHPLTGRYRATKFGVGLGTNTYDGLTRMIRAKEAETLAWRNQQLIGA